MWRELEWRSEDRLQLGTEVLVCSGWRIHKTQYCSIDRDTQDINAVPTQDDEHSKTLLGVIYIFMFCDCVCSGIVKL